MQRTRVLVAALALIVAGVCVSAASNNAAQPAPQVSIDITDLHLKANTKDLPVLVIADLT